MDTLPFRRKSKKAAPSMEGCPICMDDASKPAKECVNGHRICRTCRRRVFECPMCRGAYPGPSGPQPQPQPPDVPRQCSNHQHGCTERLLKRDLDKHERACAFRQYTCVICKKLLAFPAFKQHCVLEHAVEAGRLCYQLGKRPVQDTWKTASVIESHGEYFWFKGYFRKDVMYCGVYLARNTSTNNKYKCVFKLHSASGQSKMKITTYVHSINEHKERTEFTPCEKCVIASRVFMDEDSNIQVLIINL